ncbi:polysaccharide deacetylase family protein [Emcibacter nanhaiensis]|uniref:Polysaccharide deacetylase n=1 Tax=Emcibacter nanhaiensis TaxID=1505037 RepID=A0A501PSK2_9PROT|nr:polysaccharide deacetylase family protein [Emcibacter nanhaiensis]TPD63077.1 hypothetical protein FIV46_03070 [Emcibacter nanhaiensis]
MKTKVVLTVDTEPSIAGAFDDPDKYSPLIHEPVWGEADGKSQATGFMIETLKEHGQIATFFVETAHTAYFSDAPMGRYVERLTAAGQDIQLHLHPCWASYENGSLNSGSRVSDNCSELAEDQLVELLRQGMDTIERWTGNRPTSMRTGNFATSLCVFRAMEKAGLKYASNICTAVAPPPEPALQVASGKHVFAGVEELPVTCFADPGPIGRGRLKPMQVTALSAAEQIALLNQAHNKRLEAVIIVTHPFEYIKINNFRYDGLRANKLVQSRLQKLCGFLADNPDRFDMTSLEGAAQSITGNGGATDLTGSTVKSVLRTVENFTNDRFL